MTSQNRLDKAVEIVAEVIGAIDYSRCKPTGLYQPMQYILDLGGKRLRPLIALLSYQVFRPNGNVEEVYPVMRAVEVFHNFSLLHDDVMDVAPVRRGQPTVYQKWGSNTAILSGDGMMIEAYRQLEALSPAELSKLLPVFNQMAMAVCAGQQYDMEFESKSLDEVPLADYMEMIRLKTSCLFSAAAEMGAALAGASNEDVAQLAKAVETMGLAFQVQDDYLDLFSDDYFGKKRGGDILEGKRTYLLLLAHAKAPKEVDQALDIEDDEERIDTIAQLYDSLGLKAETEKEVERLSQEAIAQLDKIGVAEECLAPLKLLFAQLVGRTI